MSARKQKKAAKAENRKGIIRIFCAAASVKRKRAKSRHARVRPHPGHGKPNEDFQRQNMGSENIVTAAK
jgi:hypothetical protein